MENSNDIEKEEEIHLEQKKKLARLKYACDGTFGALKLSDGE